MSNITALADEWLETILAADPLEATLLGYRGHDADLADLSPEHSADVDARLLAIRDRAATVDPLSLGREDAITRSVLLSLHEGHADVRRARTLDFTVAAFPVSPASTLLAYLRMVPIGSDEQAEAYLHRLAEVPRFLAQAQERLEDGRIGGLTPVTRLVDAAIAQISAFESALPSPVALDPASGMTHLASWRRRRDDIIRADVIPAFAAYRHDLIADVRPTARPDERAGLAHLPEGRERYAALVRHHTTTTLTAEDLHDTGLALMAGIHEEFRQAGSLALGTTDLASILARLRDDPALRWQTSSQILEAAESAVRRAEMVAPRWFGRLPGSVCALAAIPELESAGAAPAYYMPPAIDGSRPGTYYSNVARPTERTSFDLEAVAFHEAVPGHHLQISVALENVRVPALRRLPLFTAYIEGWGLYAERLADEMGLYSSELQRLGMLSADSWRAARLVVDTGLHHFGWSRSRAVDYLRENTAVALIDVESEIDRYLAYPGQALSYMTGRLEILRVRRRAEQWWGDAFDVRQFHDRVLADGALPLSVLDASLADWRPIAP